MPNWRERPFRCRPRHGLGACWSRYVRCCSFCLPLADRYTSILRLRLRSCDGRLIERCQLAERDGLQGRPDMKKADLGGRTVLSGAENVRHRIAALAAL